MADEQVIVSIKVEDKEVKQAEKNIDSLTDSIEELGNRIKDARTQNKEYKKQQEALNKEYKAGKISVEQLDKGTDELNKRIKINNTVIAKTSVELSKQKTQRTANIKLVNSEAGSLRRLEAQASLLNKAISGTTKETKEGRKEYARLEKELGAINEKINEQRQAFNDNTKNIGNYTASIRKAIKQNKLLKVASVTAGGGVRILGKGLKAVAKIGIFAVLSAIVAVLATVGRAFSKSANGSKFLTKAMAVLEGLFAVLTIAVDKFAGFLLKAFDDPKKAVTELWQTIKTGFLDRLSGAADLLGALGEKIKAVFTGSAEESEAASEKINKALKKIAFGETDDDAKSFIDTIKEAAKEAENLAAKFLKLEAAQRAQRGQSRSLIKDIAVLNAELERLGEVTGDDTRNMDDMREAAIQASRVANELAIKQEQLAKSRLSVINQEVALRRSSGQDIQDLLDQQADAEVALTEARSSAAIAQQKIIIEQRKIERDIFEQNLDILLDVGDRIKTEQEKQIQNEAFSIEKRKQLLEASRAALNANFDEIKKEYELYGVTAEQINDVINSSDAKQANEKLKALGINEIAVNRLREIILERKQAELDFNDIAIDLDKQEQERRTKSSKALKKKAEKDEETRIDDLLKQEEELQGFFDNIADITGRFAGNEIAIFGRIASGIVGAFEAGKVSIESALNAVAMVSMAVFDNIAERQANDLANNEALRAKELELVGDNEAAKLAINEEFDRKQNEIKLKQFNADKARALTDIFIQTAVGATEALPNLILAGIVTAFGLAQGIAVASKQPPSFAKGTSDIVNIGGSHASGNDTSVWGFSGGKKQFFGKVEKGEAMPVIKKSAVNAYQVSKLNGAFNPGNGRTFANGTPDITDNKQSIEMQTRNNEQLAAIVTDAIKGVKITAFIEDITKEAVKKMEIESNSQF